MLINANIYLCQNESLFIRQILNVEQTSLQANKL